MPDTALATGDTSGSQSASTRSTTTVTEERYVVDCAAELGTPPFGDSPGQCVDFISDEMCGAYNVTVDIGRPLEDPPDVLVIIAELSDNYLDFRSSTLDMSPLGDLAAFQIRSMGVASDGKVIVPCMWSFRNDDYWTPVEPHWINESVTLIVRDFGDGAL